MAESWLGGLNSIMAMHCCEPCIYIDTSLSLLDNQVVLELQDNGNLTTSDDPLVVFGCLDTTFIQKSGRQSRNLIRFAVNDGGLTFADGTLEKADLQYLGKVNRARAFADSYSKVVFQYMARHSSLRVEDLLATISSSSEQDNRTNDVEMVP